MQPSELPPSVSLASADSTIPGSMAGAAVAATSTPASTASSSPTQNVTINLINLMVKRKLLTEDDATDLIRQAQAEADSARAQTADVNATAAKVDLVADQAQKAVETAAANTPPPSSPDGDEVRVTYVPEVVKEQMRNEIKRDVLQQEKEEGWSKPDATPEWVHRFRVTGDIRFRTEDDVFPSGNAPGRNFNYNAVNTTAPYNLNGTAPFPTFNVDQDRTLLRLRARIGAEIDLDKNFTAGLRIGTGADNSPVTENQTLGGVGGVTGGQGGDFSKYAVWLDRAFIRYEYGSDPDHKASVTVGRFDNPFFSTSMIWQEDIGFDGAAIQGRYKVADGIVPFFAGGAFPVYNTDLNIGTTSTVNGESYKSNDKWLYAAQGGSTFVINKDWTFRGALAIYDFENIEGKVGPLIDQTVDENPAYVGPTDNSRPSFAQKGNTYIYLRNVNPSQGVNNPLYQYYGLATAFRETALTFQLDLSRFDPLHVWVVGEAVKNVAFDKNAIENNGPSNARGPVNNFSNGSFGGGDMGYNVRLNLGKPSLEKLWDWNAAFTYRYLESDAVVDGFNDSDFGGGAANGGGTNVQGFIVGGNLAFSKHVFSSLRWFSTNSLTGPPLSQDFLQFDINAKF